MNKLTTNTLWPMGRAQRRAGKTRGKLLDAALAVFAESGFDAATIEMITEKADVGKGTFYRHFVDKYQLLQDLVHDSLARLTAQVCERTGSEKTLEEILEKIFIEHTEFFLRHIEQYVLLFQGRMLLQLGRNVSSELETPYLKYLERLEHLVRPYLPAGTDSAKIRKLSCAIAGFVFGFFSFAMTGLTRQQIADGIKPLRKAFVESMAGFLEQQ